MTDAIQSDDLIKRYKLHRVNSHRRINVMSVVAQGDLRPVPPLNVSHERKITHLESEINSFRKQFVNFKSLISQSASSSYVSHSFSTPSLNQTSLDHLSFVLELFLRPPKLVIQRLLGPSSVSYHSVAFSGHSSAVAAKVGAIYVAKGKSVSINVHQHFSSTPISKGKHIRFTYYDDEE